MADHGPDHPPTPALQCPAPKRARLEPYRQMDGDRRDAAPLRGKVSRGKDRIQSTDNDQIKDQRQPHSVEQQPKRREERSHPRKAVAHEHEPLGRAKRFGAGFGGS